MGSDMLHFSGRAIWNNAFWFRSPCTIINTKISFTYRIFPRQSLSKLWSDKLNCCQFYLCRSILAQRPIQGIGTNLNITYDELDHHKDLMCLEIFCDKKLIKLCLQSRLKNLTQCINSTLVLKFGRWNCCHLLQMRGWLANSF